MTDLFKIFQKHQREADAKLHQLHLERVKQSLRPHNTLQWYDLSVYLREWFFTYTFIACGYRDAETLLNDIKARFPDCDYELAEFDAMLRSNYEVMQPGGHIVFRREDFFAPCEFPKNFTEIDEAKALPPPAWLKGLATMIILVLFSSCQKIFDDQPHCYVCTTHNYTTYPSTAMRRDTCSVTDAQIEQYELDNDKQPYSRVICNFKN